VSLGRLRLLESACVALLALACGSSPHPSNPAAATPPTSSVTPLPGVRIAEVTPAPNAELRWFEDDADGALRTARETGKLLFVDLWAPWCHTCLSMREYVMTGSRVPALGKDFVLLAIDTEKEQNAEFLKRFPVTVWPTFYVVDPTSLEVRGRWLGASSPAKLDRFLSDSRRDRTPSDANDPLALVVEADALAAKQELGAAAEKYGAALARAPADWSRRPDVLVAHLSALYRSGNLADCSKQALSAMNQTGSGVSAVDFASTALTCAEKSPDKKQQLAVRGAAEVRLAPICENPAPELTPDDHADSCSNLRRARRALGDIDGARRAAERSLEIIDAACAGVPDDVALIYDFERSDALSFLGRREEAIALLTRREANVPTSYNPPHHLARVYRDARRWDEGLAAIERALAKAYGPRRINLMSVQVDLLLGAGKKDEAYRTLEEQIRRYEALPKGQAQPAGLAAARDRLKQLR
jgi:tetratricopeptide (TPR) repeat protein